ncbi:Flp pilus assembly complex ATPase component TadA [Aerococcaceae bacterium NML201209]|nr:Flp pilus assembly complex ATPase component TadA [Aerococcaceae bacterium NML201209]
MNIEADARRLIQEALRVGVSDVHILPEKQTYVIYLRINGRLERLRQESLEWGKRLISYFKFLANMDVGEKRKPQSGAAHLEIEGCNLEMRFSTITNVLFLESLVIRLIRQHKQIATRVQTYFPKDIEVLRRLVRRKSGLLLFSGPVGSGKTTTIYQLLRERMASDTMQVITMEDPVEIYEESFLQTEVNERAGITYDALIKASLRHHPDILMIGEIRDSQTARMVIRGALTGHLMIATIHAKNVRGVIARLQELGVSDEQLRQTLIGVVSQRLVPRFCVQCAGVCNKACTALAVEAKRYALLEILVGSALQQVVGQGQQVAAYQTLNEKLRKAWAYGYIDTATFEHFEVE